MTLLDETTCPVCGKDLTHPNIDMSIWAVAHYLAHLVQQNQPLDDGVYMKALIGDDPANPASWSAPFILRQGQRTQL